MRNFLAKVAKAYLITVGLITTFFFILLYVAVLKYTPEVKTTPAMTEPSLIHITLQGAIIESLDKRSPFETVIDSYFYDSEKIYLPQFKQKLEQMAEDPLVRGLFLEFKPMTGSLVAFEELHKLLAIFKEKSQKPIQAWLASADSKDYYIASIADEITMPPESHLAVFGPVFSLVYFGEALKKLGIGVDYIRQGSFKSAVEPFTRNEPSYETRAMYESLEKNMRDNFIKSIANRWKPLDADAVKDIFAHSFFTAKQALNIKAISKISYKIEAIEDFSAEQAAQMIKIDDYLLATKDQQKSSSTISNNDNGIALIEARGQIVLHDIGGSEEVIVPDNLIEELQWARDNDKVKAVVLRISSPGGSPIGSELIWKEVKLLAETKPLVVSMGSYAASGGYYIATPAKEIWASPYTLTGSIGVFHLLFDGVDLEKKYGISFPIITGSKRKDWIGLGSKPSDDDRKLLQQNVDQTYETFLNRVSEGRQMSLNQVKAVAGGRVWTGSQAVDVKLVDKLGGIYEVYTRAKELAGFPKDTKVPVYRWQAPITNLKECLRDMKRCFYPSKNISLKIGPQKFSLSDLQAHNIKNELKRYYGEGTMMLWPDYKSFD